MFVLVVIFPKLILLSFFGGGRDYAAPLRGSVDFVNADGGWQHNVTLQKRAGIRDI